MYDNVHIKQHTISSHKK